MRGGSLAGNITPDTDESRQRTPMMLADQDRYIFVEVSNTYQYLKRVTPEIYLMIFASYGRTIFFWGVDANPYRRMR